MKQDDIDAIVGFHIHRGILAIGLRDPTTSTSTSTPTSTSTVPPPITIALMGIVNHDNVGGIFRNAAAFGAARIVMDDVTCDPLYRKAIRVSVGGALIVPFERFLSAEAMLQWLHDTNIETLALSPAGNERLTDMTPSRPTAILLGPEGPGLPKEVLARLRTVRIPIVSTFDSLNVSVACGIALAHLCARAL
jgi:tRNA G18 (ribose-2'-O)-methylase SpoU